MSRYSNCLNYYNINDVYKLRDQVKLPTKTKRTHEGKPTEKSEKTTVKIQRKLSYPPIDQVLPTSEKKIVKSGVPGKTKRCNELYYLMRCKLISSCAEYICVIICSYF